jgi:methylated-DNA-[protein]-cysteine S-methyltransferase
MDRICLNTPIGWLRIRGDGDSIHEISFDPTGNEESGNQLLLECARQIDAFFLGKLKNFDIPITLQGTPFQKKVLNAVLKIPFGETRSYLQLADILGDSKAVRAVGNANARNPLPLIIPCHRVIGTHGSLTGYAGGIWRKRWLLQHESRYNQLPLFSSLPS